MLKQLKLNKKGEILEQDKLAQYFDVDSQGLNRKKVLYLFCCTFPFKTTTLKQRPHNLILYSINVHKGMFAMLLFIF